MPEFRHYQSCGLKVFARNNKLLGFCTRREHHEGPCSHLINDRKSHDLTYQEIDTEN